ncbi:MAG: DUF732 domain-containing protein [Gordonia sp. (in: high G+C Gram-positive bacteria)]|uniref:DUF732 domain-containing protein n=1 Tax=Gordonia sp. (in: high G+C Gram-positive bacteria) TaxID=84139 RepID=UPI003BB804DB
MTGKNTRGLLVCAALVAAAFGATACGDSSTATAPLTQDATIATMSGHSSARADSSVPAGPSDGAAASSSAEAAASKATTELPATKPSSAATNTGNGNGEPDSGQANGRTLSAKEKSYVAALKRDNVTFMGDDDNTIALAWGHYVCREKGKNTDPTVIKVYIRAGIGPTTQSDQEAGAKADKLISAAEKNLC